MLEPAQIALMNKARQIGLSHAEAGRSVKDALIEGSANIILSASQELSAEVLMKAKAHARVLDRLGFKGAKVVESNATRIGFANGGRVIALPANPRTARSFTGNVTFDEAAYHQDFKAIWDAAAAMSTRASSARKMKIRVVSTPNGAQGQFYDWAQNPPKGWAVHTVTIEDALRQGMPVDLNHLWEISGHDERVYSQWFRCAFLDASMQYVPTAMADRALNWSGSQPDWRGADIFAGLDVGRINDLTALSVIAVVDEVAYVVAILTCQRTAFKDQKRMIDDAYKTFQWHNLHVDQTGLGAGLAEELVDEYGEDEVIPISFTVNSKDDLATRAMRWFRDDKIRFPKNKEGKALRDETIAIKRVVKPSGTVCFDAPQSEQGHGDRWWATCLALKGAGEPQNPMSMGQVPLLPL
jgi:phage FluMu gp28-like protein